ncbi:MAG: cyclic lactone autoinducer peptide [Acetatifactor sp.]|nr:cyclic lactone autoinducer peptide [Acetatifactor sp.]
MADVDTKVSCPWIHYQPEEPRALREMRAGKVKK